jgi:phospholipid transport system substrate-binding protein
MRRLSIPAFGAYVLVAFLFAIPVHAAAAEAENFIRNMGSKAFASLGEEGISEQERIERFEGLLEEAFDLPRIARFTLGRYWRVATDEEKKEYIDLFEKFVVQAYANRFRDLSGKKLNVLQSRDVSATQALVLSEIVIPNQPSVKINWRVRSKDDTHKITDVMVEGISMSVTQRDEFVSVIRQTGGKVAGLINALRKKTSSN